MSEPIKNTSELIDKYAGILENIVRHATQGSYTYHGVISCFLNEWIELSPPERDWDTQEEIYEALTEGLTNDDQLLNQLEEKTRKALNLDDPAIMQAFNAHRDGRRSE